MNKLLKRKIIFGVNLASILNEIKIVNKLLTYETNIFHFFSRDLEFDYVAQEALKGISEFTKQLSCSTIHFQTDR